MNSQNAYKNWKGYFVMKNLILNAIPKVFWYTNAINQYMLLKGAEKG